MDSILTLFFWLLVGFSTAYFAYQRGRNPYAWFMIGVFFGLLGLLFVFLLPVVNANEAELNERGNDSQEVLTLLPSRETHDFLVKDWFYLDSQNKQEGPISFAILNKILEEGKIQKSTFVWCEGMGDWKRIEDFSELKDLLSKEKG